MKSLDELRRCFGTDCYEDESACKQYRSCTEHWLSLIDAAERELAERYVELPVDADGEAIHIGDVLYGYGKSITVVSMRLEGFGWVLISEQGGGFHDCHAFTHYHAPTVEDVLREFAQEMNENLGMYKGEAIDADEWRDADAKTITEYAAKLRLAEEDE